MSEEHTTVTAAEVRVHPALKKLARAYIALARQLHESSSTARPAAEAAASLRGPVQ